MDGLMMDYALTIGYDIHAFDTGGDAVWLGGVKIPHERKLAGHSDADVALHALTDAIPWRARRRRYRRSLPAERGEMARARPPTSSSASPSNA